MKKLFGLLLLVLCIVSVSAYATEAGHECDWGEWISNGGGTHTRTCMTDATHIQTENCAPYTYAMIDEQNPNHYILCECLNGDELYVLGTEAHTLSDWYMDEDIERRECTKNCDYYENREPHTCTWEWTYDSTLHWQKCSDPDCSESSTAAQAHQFDDDNDAACNTCGYTRTIEHTHDWGEWTFNGDGTHTRVCKTDSSHTESGSCDSFKWFSNSEGHMKSWVCKNVCGGGTEEILSNEYYHEYSNDTDLTCDICGYVRTVEGSLSITGSMPAATVGEAYSASFGYSGTVSGVVFWNATGLPDGLSINAGSGIVSGTPTTAGSYSVTIAMGATGGGSASMDFTLTVNAPAHVCSFSTATCTTPATCSCNATQGGVDKSNHVGGTEIRNAVAAGEFTEGYTGDTHCKGCGDKLADGETIPATHACSYSTATCTTSATCTDPACGATSGGVDKSNHTGGTEIRNDVAAGEFTEGYTGDTHCKGCGDKLADGETIPATHVCSYSSYAYDSNGHWTVCSCGATTSVNKHRWYIYKKDANKHYWHCACGNNGWGDLHADDNNTGKCDECGYEMPHVHDWDSWEKYADSHIRYCKHDTSHYELESCSYKVTDVGYDSHELTCSGCGDCLWMDHHFAAVDDEVHTYVCTVCEYKTGIEHLYNIYKYDGTNHWLVCGCGQGLNGSVEKHTFGNELKSDGNGHWKVCTACSYAAKKEAHTMTLKQSIGKFWYHLYVCEMCGYEDTENCTMQYVGNADGHEYLCTACGKKSDTGVQPHSDENGDEKCDQCGEANHVHQYTYTANLFDETRHTGKCGCGSLISAAHADHNGDLNCDDCGQAMPTTMAKDAVKVEFVPGDGVTLPEDAELVVESYTTPREPFRITIPKTSGEFGGAWKASTPLLSQLEAGKTYNVFVVGANNIYLRGAVNINGKLKQTFGIPEQFRYNQKVTYGAVHVLFGSELSHQGLNINDLWWTQSDADPAWGDENNGVEFGSVSISEDGKVLTALHDIYSFSPFIVYAFVEADEP